MTVEEIIKILNIGKNTLFMWEEHFSIDVKRDSKGRRFYTAEDLKILQTIKALRDNDNGLNTITRMLDDELKEISRRNIENYQDEDNLDNEISNEINQDKNKNIIAYIDDKMDSIIELGDKYSNACLEIGRLQSELKLTENSLKKNQENHQKDLQMLKKEIDKKDLEIQRLSNDNEFLRKKIESYAEELEKTRNRPIWKSIFSK